MKIALAVGALFALGAIAACLAVIWTSDGRWGLTAGVFLFMTVIAGGIAGAMADAR